MNWELLTSSYLGSHILLGRTVVAQPNIKYWLEAFARLNLRVRIFVHISQSYADIKINFLLVICPIFIVKLYVLM